MKRKLACLTLLAFAVLWSAGFTNRLSSPPERDGEMRQAATEWLASLSEEQRSLVQYPLTSEEQDTWFFTPRPPRNGLPLKEMDEVQKRLAFQLLKTAMSDSGMALVNGVRELEALLAIMEQRPVYRDPGKYYLTVFGEPDGQEPWGWTYEGHHLSANYTSMGDKLISSTPIFVGANPGRVPDDQDRAGFRLLAEEEDKARSLMASFDEDQRAQATISSEAPNEIITVNDRTTDRITGKEGLPTTQMSTESRGLLMSLINEYIERLHPDLDDAFRARIAEGNLDDVYFAWAGSLTRGEAHYYRIHGDNVLIEYDNTQNDANHVHTVWRDPSRDFGRDALEEHYRSHPH